MHYSRYSQKTYNPGSLPLRVPLGGCVVCSCTEGWASELLGVPMPRVTSVAVQKLHGNGATPTKHPLYCCFPQLLLCGDKDLGSLVTAGAPGLSELSEHHGRVNFWRWNDLG